MPGAMLYLENFTFVLIWSYYCSNVYLCSLWVKFRKSAMKQLVVAYNNAFIIMHRLPMRCSDSLMFANDARVDSCEARIRKSIGYTV